MRNRSTMLVVAAAIAAAACANSKPDRVPACRTQYERGNPSIARYGPDGGRPERIIEGPRTLLCRPSAVAVGSGGEIFVLDQMNYAPPNPSGGSATGDTRLLVFDSAASGDVAPVYATVFARDWGRSVEGLGFDRKGRLYILSAATIPARGGSIWVYDATAAGSPELIRVIQGAAGVLERPSGLAFDTRGGFYITDNIEDAGQILVYGEGANGDPVVRRTISGLETLLRLPVKLALGPGDTLYVLNAFYRSSACRIFGVPNTTVTVYAPGATDDVEPLRILTVTQNGASPGREYGYVGGRGLEVDSEGNVYVWMGGPQTLVFAPGSSGLVAPTRVIEAPEPGAAEPAGVTRTPAGLTYQTYRPRRMMC